MKQGEIRSTKREKMDWLFKQDRWRFIPLEKLAKMAQEAGLYSTTTYLLDIEAGMDTVRAELRNEQWRHLFKEPRKKINSAG